MGNKGLRLLYAGLLGALLSFGCLGCLISGFDLTFSRMELGFACLLLSFCMAGALSFRWGMLGIGAVSGVCGVYLWQQGLAAQQVRNLLYSVTDVFSDAYGWNYVLPGEALGITLPIWIFAFLVILAVNAGVLKGIGPWPGIFLSLIPVGACLVTPDTPPDSGYLFAWLLALCLQLLTAHPHIRAFQAKLGSRNLLPVAAALGILFLAMPQKNYVNQSESLKNGLLSFVREIPGVVEDAAGRLQLDFSGKGRDRVELSALGPNPGHSYPVMEVSSTVSRVLYLRGQDYDVYTGTAWSSTRHRNEGFWTEGRENGTVSIHTRLPQSLLYIPYHPAWEVQLVSGKAENADKLTDYAFDLVEPAEMQPGDGIAATGGSPTAASLQELRALPEETARWAQEFRQAQGLASPGDIAAFLQSHAQYDLNTPAMPEGEEDFARWFAEQGETGYCVHFAATAAVLLRSLGYSARFVTGYMAQVTAGETVTVTAKDAHAWAEYYDSFTGTWKVLEATPAASLPEAPVQGEPQVKPVTPDIRPKPALPGYTWSVVLVLALLAVLCQRHARLYFRQQQWHRGRRNLRALNRYALLQQLAEAAGEALPAEVNTLAEKARFSQHTLTERELRVFEDARQALLDKLGKMPWYRQLYFMFIKALF